MRRLIKKINVLVILTVKVEVPSAAAANRLVNLIAENELVAYIPIYIFIYQKKGIICGKIYEMIQ